MLDGTQQLPQAPASQVPSKTLENETVRLHWHDCGRSCVVGVHLQGVIGTVAVDPGALADGVAIARSEAEIDTPSARPKAEATMSMYRRAMR